LGAWRTLGSVEGKDADSPVAVLPSAALEQSPAHRLWLAHLWTRNVARYAYVPYSCAQMVNPVISLLRLPLELIPRSTVVPVLWGPLRGARWIVGAGNHVAWLGLYEHQKQQTFTRLVRPGSVVYDIGAHAGFYTLLASRLVGETGQVVAFEPLPRNIDFLKAHLRLNDVRNVRVLAAAVGDHEGPSSFQEHSSSYMGRLGAGQHLRVLTVAIDQLVDRGEIPPPDWIKLDIEGGELHALQGAQATLERYHPGIFLATHGLRVHTACLDLLSQLDYSIWPVVGQSAVETDELLAVHRDEGLREAVAGVTTLW
jgi:FkbM family methyltransferase